MYGHVLCIERVRTFERSMIAVVRKLAACTAP
jgi:hypothetical protein